MKAYTLERVHRLVKNVKGALSDNEGEFLHKAAKEITAEGVIVEIGSFQGKSTIYLASAVVQKQTPQVYAVDPHSGGQVLASEFSPPTYKSFIKNLSLAGVRNVVKPIRAYSWDAVKKWHLPICMLFIDGDHSSEAVKKDVNDWLPFVSPGGIIAFHDVLNPDPGPVSAIISELLPTKNSTNMGFTDSIFYCTNSRPRGLRQHLQVILFTFLLYVVQITLLFSTYLPHKKIQRFFQQYVVKRWLKRFYSLISSTKYLHFSDNKSS